MVTQEQPLRTSLLGDCSDVRPAKYLHSLRLQRCPKTRPIKLSVLLIKATLVGPDSRGYIRLVQIDYGPSSKYLFFFSPEVVLLYSEPRKDVTILISPSITSAMLLPTYMLVLSVQNCCISLQATGF